jgi:DivIVA domain-containing protein
MKLRKKDKAEETGGFDTASGGVVGGARITPTDVQERKFRRSSRPSGGYVMREVDEFLDEVTDTLSALIAENERLRLAAGATPAGPTSVPARDPGDRAAVDSFLRREKEFLQDLGGLVQTHATELKSMVRSARASSAPAEAIAAQAPAAEADAEVTAVAAAPEAATPPVVEAEPVAPGPAVEEEPVAPVPAVDEEPVAPAVEEQEPDEAPTDTATTGVAEQPIRVEDPEPARSGRSDDQDRSLRELFWGEE